MIKPGVEIPKTATAQDRKWRSMTNLCFFMFFSVLRRSNKQHDLTRDLGGHSEQPFEETMSWSYSMMEIVDVMLRVPPLFVMDSILKQTFLVSSLRMEHSGVSSLLWLCLALICKFLPSSLGRLCQQMRIQTAPRGEPRTRIASCSCAKSFACATIFSLFVKRRSDSTKIGSVTRASWFLSGGFASL